MSIPRITEILENSLSGDNVGVAGAVTNTMLTDIHDSTAKAAQVIEVDAAGADLIGQKTMANSKPVTLASDGILNKVYSGKLGVGALKTVTTAGTAEALAGSSTPCHGVWIVPKVASDTDNIYIAESSSLDGGANGGTINACPFPAAGMIVSCTDAADIYIDVDTAADGAYWQPVLDR
jgi:hypothetical protein